MDVVPTLDPYLGVVGGALAGRKDSHRMTEQYIHADGHRLWGALVLSCMRDCIPASLSVGWIALGIAFLIGIVGTLKSGQAKNAAVAAVIVSLLGVVVSATNLFDYIFNNSGRTGG
jgi:hypothetical protein